MQELIYGAKPLLKAVTGQGKLEKKIQKQFEEMEPEEFDKMAKYMTEEVITSLKPHCAILNALVKASQSRCKSECEGRINPELKDLQQQIDALNAKGNLSPKEQDELIAARSRKDELQQEKQQLMKNAQEIKDGTKSKSADIKGNYQGKKFLNLFARRNHTTKEYGPKLDEYADAETHKVEEKAYAEYEESMGNKDEARNRRTNEARYKEQQEQIMQENTYSKHGVHKSVFNGAKDGSTIKAISREMDTTIRNIGMLATASVAVARVVRNIDQAIEAANQNAEAAKINADEARRIEGINNSNVDQTNAQVSSIKNGMDMSDNEFGDALKSEVASRANAGEMTNVHKYGTVSHTNSAYVADDLKVNQNINSELNSAQNSSLQGKNFGEKLRVLADSFRDTGSAQQTTANEMNGMTVQSGVDHSAQETAMNSSMSGKEVEAKMLEKLADVYDKVKGFNPGVKVKASTIDAIAKVKKDFLGPVMVGLAPLMGIVSDHRKNRQEAKWHKKNKEIDDNEEVR